MAKAKTEAISGRQHYEEIYQTELESEAEWLRYGAPSKVNSVETLLNRNGIKPISLLELGCGTGAVIVECQRRGLGTEFTAVDSSETAIGYLKSHSAGICCITADITDPGFALDQCFDVVVLSHVLEHLEEPLTFLLSLSSRIRFRYLVAEVPLEDLWASRIKNLVRDRKRNAAGHVQFFTQTTIQRLLAAAGFELKDSSSYVPISSPAVLEFVSNKDGLSKFQTFVRKATGYYLPRVLKPLWGRFYYSNYAALCVPGRQ